MGMGVAMSASKFRVEQCAYNEASFRIPDVRGYVAEKEHIDPCCPLGRCINSDVEMIKEVVEDLSSTDRWRGWVDVSTDPGRYLCNYLYYLSMSKDKNSAESGITDMTGNIRNSSVTIFLHVPPFHIISEDA